MLTIKERDTITQMIKILESSLKYHLFNIFQGSVHADFSELALKESQETLARYINSITKD